ncbi:glutamate decarboxylase [Cuniculiplasma sp. SKW4]|uniref:glutamate decarboxylase n=1 Tax=Cuniculiplasma sp. SKW4 TaxID=3400171 RepID=UPI003FD4B1CA
MVSKKIEKGRKERSIGHSRLISRYNIGEIPKYSFPKDGIDSRVAYQLIHDELNLDGNPDLNLATFVTTWMEPEADKLIIENLHKNFIDHFEYPQIKEIEERIVNIMAELFNAPEEANFAGTSTIGSSEAIMLGLLAHKFNWREKRKKAGLPYDKPNIVFGGDTHISWDKFARYFDVEPRIVPISETRFNIDWRDAVNLVDENTIAVGVVLGTTFTGDFDPVQEINDALVQLKENRGLDVPIHVDAASAGFITPFYEPDFKWDFRLEQVKSINTSGHKFGLVYPGIGWLIFRDESALPEDLGFNVNYLGDEMPTYTLNFSEGSSMIVAQYYNIIRLGVSGYRAIVSGMMDNAHYLAQELEKTGKFDIINRGVHVPVVTFKPKDSLEISPFEISYNLRERGWIVPAYSLPKNAEHMTVMRVVVRENFTKDMIDIFVKDINTSLNKIKTRDVKIIKSSPRKGHPVS